MQSASNYSLRTFDGAIAIITGGASGIGRALGEALAQRGARVVLADRQIGLAEEVAARIRNYGGHADTEELDVTDFAATRRLVERTYQGAGRLGYLFNNAGIGIIGEARLCPVRLRLDGEHSPATIAHPLQYVSLVPGPDLRYSRSGSTWPMRLS